MGAAGKGEDSGVFPRTLAEVQKGATNPGDCGSVPFQSPPWLDKDKFRRGQEFFRNHTAALLLSLHCSLTTGFCIVNLLDPLVFTKKSDTGPKAQKRYFQTALHLLSWVFEEIWDETKSRAFKSIQTVRRMHRFVGNSMNKKFVDNGQLYVSQYDMGLVQCGFMGAIVMYPEGFGVKCTKQDLEDYIHFWRGLGYLLGIDDKYNICAGNYQQTYDICKQIEVEKLLPGLEKPPKNFNMMVDAYIDGTNSMSLLPLHSLEAVKAFTYDGMGLPVPQLNWADTLRVWFYKTQVFMIRWLPGYEWLTNSLLRSFYNKMGNTVDLEAKGYH